MNPNHPVILNELVRQRQLHMLNEARHWTSRVRLRRRERQLGVTA